MTLPNAKEDVELNRMAITQMKSLIAVADTQKRLADATTERAAKGNRE